MAKATQQQSFKIRKPRITEKAALLSEKNVYVFEIEKDSNKSEIKKEVEAIYNVKPVKVNIAKTASKNKVVKGRRGTKAGVTKAYVYLKEGDKISLM